ncbi:GGDEF/PAS/PAC-domain containing protein [Desulfovibrio sp. TomC]|nr:GGDEF/PAS/PAC-domain containing protein [Desulfovibrio sp. TomC]
MRHDALEHGRSLLHRAASDAAAGQDAVAGQLRQLLSDAAAEPALMAMDMDAADAVLQRLVEETSAIGNAFVCDLAGNVTASAKKPFAGVRSDRRRYFLEALRQGGFVAGDFAVARVSGGPSIHFAQPIRNRSGQVVGVLGVAVPLAWYQQLFGTLDVPSGAFLAFFDVAGVLLARFPPTQSIQSGDRFEALFQGQFSWQQDSGSFVIPSPDGVETLYAYKILHLGKGAADPYGVMFVGIPMPQALEEARDRMLATAAVSAGSVVLAVLLAAVLCRAAIVNRLTVLAGFAASLGQDRVCLLPPRFGTDEIAQLGRRMVEMSLSLHEKNEHLAAAMTSLGLERDALARAVEALRQAKEELTRRADYDELTGLRNRHCFFERLRDEMARLRRYGTPFSLAILDIDDFKQINDSCGHSAGDAVLRALGQTLGETLRDVDEAYRVGGEEFALVLPATASGQGFQVAERVRLAVAGLTVPFGRESLRCTVSLGLAEADAGVDAEKDLFAAADRALYAAKAAGKNCSRLDPGAHG